MLLFSFAYLFFFKRKVSDKSIFEIEIPPLPDHGRGGIVLVLVLVTLKYPVCKFNKLFSQPIGGDYAYLRAR